MKYYITLFFCIALLSSCMTEKKPKIVHSKEETSSILKDSSFMKMADLPVHIDSTEYLLHPVGEFKIKDNRGKLIFSSPNYGSSSFSISSSNNYHITGNLSNVLFQNLTSAELKPLTENNIRIKSVIFLREVYKNTKQEFLLYEVIDQDTNKDKKLDGDDIKSLYLSKIDGSNFKKLTTPMSELLEWKIIPVVNRLYFKTVEDTNKDGDFDENDKVFYKYVDLNLPITTVVEYNPL
jgi:hypothetical protein